MSRRHNRFDQYREKFFRVPKVFTTNPKYKKMSNDAKMAYAILQDRQELSIKNGWYDDKGDIYFIYSNPKLAEILDVHVNTVTKIRKELVKAELLDEKPTGRAIKFYLLKPEVTEDDVYLIDESENATGDSPEDLEAKKEAETVEPQAVHKICEADTTKSVKQVHKICEADSQNLCTNDTDINHTDFSHTDSSENLNLNHRTVDIYDILWNLNIPHTLKNKIKVMISSNQINLNSEQILGIEDSYNHHIQNGLINPNCAFDDIEALNNHDVEKTVTKMLETVSSITNMRGLMKDWLQNAFTYKRSKFSVSDFSGNNMQVFNWLDQ